MTLAGLNRVLGWFGFVCVVEVDFGDGPARGPERIWFERRRAYDARCRRGA